VAIVTTELSSAAAATEQNLLSLLDRQFSINGSFVKTVLWGVFGSNGNDKQILVNAAGVGTIFDSGTVTYNGVRWKMEIINMRSTNFPKRYFTEMTYYTGDGITKSATRTYGVSTALNPAFRVSGVSAGDVQIWGGFAELFIP
jgi:hypothetical protein